MKLSVTTQPSRSVACDLVGIVAFEEEVGDLDAPLLPGDGPTLERLLRQRIRDERFKGKPGQSLIIETGAGDGTSATRLAVVGAGSRSTFNPADYRHAAAALVRVANGVGAKTLLVAQDRQGRQDRQAAEENPSLQPTAADRERRDSEQARRVEALTQGVLLGAYRFDRYLGPEKKVPVALETVLLQIAPTPTPDDGHHATAALDRGRRVALAASIARDLVNEPAGVLTPTALAADVGARAKTAGLDVVILGPEECRKRGMGMFLAVAQGSSEEPRFVHLSWRPKEPRKRVVLVGKGVTFDSGGLSLKTTEGMLDMKSDMAGAAAVLSAITVAAEEKLPIEVHAIAACTENMPSGTAYKLGDVLRSMAGKTVEINNTDAEGRLTLADALTYGLELNPDVILDFATLTGACVVALGPHTAGVMSNDAVAAGEWMAAAATAGEDMWRLPLPPRLFEQLKSEIADMRNTGERWGGALTAGLFLKEFVGATPWIHVDIAGPATASKEWGCFGKGATGFGVASIVEYLRTVADSSRP